MLNYRRYTNAEWRAVVRDQIPYYVPSFGFNWTDYAGYNKTHEEAKEQVHVLVLALINKDKQTAEEAVSCIKECMKKLIKPNNFEWGYWEIHDYVPKAERLLEHI